MTLISDISTVGMGKLKETFKLVFLGILTATIGSVMAFQVAPMIVGWMYWGIVIAEFAVLFWFMFTKNIFSYFIFTTLTGITLVPVLYTMVNAGASGAIINALFATTAITAGLTWYASTTEKNYLGIGQVLFWVLIGIIVMSIINIFIGSSILALGISAVAVILFSFFIIHDVQEVLQTDIEPIDAAMGIYLDILNLFVHLLHIFGVMGDD